MGWEGRYHSRPSWYRRRRILSQSLVPKALHPTVLYLGRLKAYKSVNVLIQAFRIVLSERPETKLIIAGDGEEREASETIWLKTSGCHMIRLN